MYRALESFTTKTYDVKRNQILEDDFTIEKEIQEYLRIGYIEAFTSGTIKITENGIHDVEDYGLADVDVHDGSGYIPTVSNNTLGFISGSNVTVQGNEVIIQ